MTLIVCDDAEKVNTVLKLVDEGSVMKLKVILVIESMDNVNADMAKKNNVTVVGFKDAMVRQHVHQVNIDLNCCFMEIVKEQYSPKVATMLSYISLLHYITVLLTFTIEFVFGYLN